MLNKLVLFTAEFPFGFSDSFLETEINYLSKAFDEVQLVVIEPGNKVQRSKLPSNCFVKPVDVELSFLEKIAALFYFFHPLFWQELRIIRKIYQQQLSVGIISCMLISLYRSHKIKKYSEAIVLDTPHSTKLFFYSYWCDDSALSLAFLQRKYPHITSFSRLHGWDVYFKVNEFNYLPFRHFITDNLKAIFAISEYGKEYCKNVWKINHPEKIKVAQLGVRTQVQTQPCEEFILISCSSIIKLKRIDLIVSALSKLNDLTIRWVHFGEGVEMDRINEMAKKMLPSNIHWELKGRIANTEILEWYAVNRPSLLINVSSSEGIPVSIMEAMSFGIPAIATDVGGSGEIVNSENGLLLPANPSVEEIATAIRSFFLLNKEQKNSKSENARKMWGEKYNAEKNYLNFINYIKDLK
jgi:glycosyltransferase involved in cell wall biosynthesis